jgi:hypothetical protein
MTPISAAAVHAVFNTVSSAFMNSPIPRNVIAE